MFRSRVTHIKRRIGERLAGETEKLYSPKNKRRSVQKKRRATEFKFLDFLKSNKEHHNTDATKAKNEPSQVPPDSIPEERSEDTFSIRLSGRKRNFLKKSPLKASFKLGRTPFKYNGRAGG